MLITDKFVFVHLPKTGGNFIRQACEGQVVETLDWHLSVRDIPERYAHLPVFAVVRNPWDWYVSMYHFMQAHGVSANDPWARLSDHGRLTFDATVWRAMGLTPAPIGTYLRRRDRDYYSALWWQTFGHDERVTVGRLDTIRSDFWAFLDKIGVPASDTPNLPATALNRSDHGPYRSYYSDELRAMVAHKARHLIRTYGYRF